MVLPTVESVRASNDPVAVREDRDVAVARREEVSSFIFAMICRLLGSRRNCACPDIVRLHVLAPQVNQTWNPVATFVRPEATAGEQKSDHAVSADDLSCSTRSRRSVFVHQNRPHCLQSQQQDE